MRTCFDCKYFGIGIMEVPCLECTGRDEFKPKKSKELEKHIQPD